MKILAAIGVLALTELSFAGTFVGQAYMDFIAANGSIPRVPVDVEMTTDYSSLTWTISWDVPETTVIGGPDQNFETSFGTKGAITLNAPVKLGLPNASGIVQSGSSSVVAASAFEFFGTSRVVTRNETWATTSANVTGGFYLTSLNVSPYPDSLHLTADTFNSSMFNMSTTTTDGNAVSLSGRLYAASTGSKYGIDSDMYESLPGDFTSDGAVDAADYTVARDVATPLTALMTNLDTWRQSYGNSLAIPVTTIPEPTALTLAAMLLGSLGIGQWSRHPTDQITR